MIYVVKYSVSLLVMICLYLVFTYDFDLQCNVAWGLTLITSFLILTVISRCRGFPWTRILFLEVVVLSTFLLFMLSSGLVPIFWGPYASLLIQDPGRLHMQFLLSSSLSLNCIGRSLRLAHRSLQWIGLFTDLALDLHWGVGSWISLQELRTLVLTREILLERFGLIFWSEMFLKSSKISWPVCPFLSTNSVNKSVYPRVGFQSGWREETINM